MLSMNAEAVVVLEEDGSNLVRPSLSNPFTIYLSTFAVPLDEIDSHCESLCKKQ